MKALIYLSNKAHLMKKILLIGAAVLVSSLAMSQSVENAETKVGEPQVVSVKPSKAKKGGCCASMAETSCCSKGAEKSCAGKESADRPKSSDNADKPNQKGTTEK